MQYSDLLQLTSIAVAIIVPLASSLLYLKSRKQKITISSQLKMIDGKAIAVIKALNARQRHTVINSIRFPLCVWCRREILTSNFFMKVLRVKDVTGAPDRELEFVSLKASYDVKKLPVKLEEGEYTTCYIDIDQMLDYYSGFGETLGNIYFFSFFMFFFNIEVVTTSGRVFKTRTNWEIRYYLWNKYKNDLRIYGGITA